MKTTFGKNSKNDSRKSSAERFAGCEALLVWQLRPSIYRRVLDIGNFQRFGEGLAHLFGHISQTEGRQGRKLLTIADRSVTKVNVPRMFAMASCSLRLL
jgi:hypothetical protein